MSRNHLRKRSRFDLLAALSLMGLGIGWSLAGCGAEGSSSATPDVFSATYGSATDAPHKLFISGHSLTGRPMPDYLASLAAGAGREQEWNMQHLGGSSLRMRTRGDGPTPWAGYRAGTDRNDKSIDVLKEFAPASSQPPYDTLIMTEVHTLLESLIWNDTVGHAVDYAERFLAQNPDGQAYVYASWLDVDDFDDPIGWISYERQATKAWQCTIMQINNRLGAKGQARPVRLIPAGEALAALAEQAVSDDGLTSLSGATPRETMKKLFADDVHLTNLGNYYVALISHIALNGSLPEDAWIGDFDPAEARGLQDFARRFMATWQQENTQVAIDCQRYLADEFVDAYLTYVRDTRWRKEDGWLRGTYKWARFSFEWPRFLRGESPENAFRVVTGSE